MQVLPPLRLTLKPKQTPMDDGAAVMLQSTPRTVPWPTTSSAGAIGSSEPRSKANSATESPAASYPMRFSGEEATKKIKKRTSCASSRGAAIVLVDWVLSLSISSTRIMSGLTAPETITRLGRFPEKIPGSIPWSLPGPGPQPEPAKRLLSPVATEKHKPSLRSTHAPQPPRLAFVVAGGDQRSLEVPRRRRHRSLPSLRRRHG